MGPEIVAILALVAAGAGFVLARIGVRIVDASLDRTEGAIRRSWYRLRSRFVAPPTTRVLPTNSYSVGPVTVRFCLVTHETYRPSTIRCFYRPDRHRLPPELQERKDSKALEYETRARAGQRAPHNSSKFKLVEFGVAFREVDGGLERPTLTLHFTDTDYYTQEVTDNAVGDLLRERYFRNADLRQRPVPEFASVFGVTLALVTADQLVIVARRSVETAVSPGQLSASMSEGALRPQDAHVDGAPDPYRTATRGVLEELRLQIREQDVEFLGFGADAQTGIYNLLGWAQLSVSRQQLEELWRHEPPTDRWEQDLYFVPFNPRGFADFVVENAQDWAPVGFVTLVLALDRAGHTRSALARAFEGHARKSASRPRLALGS